MIRLCFVYASNLKTQYARHAASLAVEIIVGIAVKIDEIETLHPNNRNVTLNIGHVVIHRTYTSFGNVEGSRINPADQFTDK